ncbi:coiled-coil domain-containing protein 124-like [Rhipicephalus sanguineus]|uniref:coiled-coil domain-containing protein 124-like n=1 Tax=Rhipicephalus sanguineus TaxID=34632 RepID=UPI0018945D80|nr:coiled-coil domain-containing protein 124-like [Rhipicephalus sanguineus]
MPKKFGTNTKSAEARAKKEAVKIADKEKKIREAEEALWADDDKHIARKQQRKEERDKKKPEQLEKKAALKQMYDEEMNSIKSVKARVEKVTRADIAALAERQQKAQKDPQEMLLHEKPLEENINRVFVENEARTVDEAIAVLRQALIRSLTFFHLYCVQWYLNFTFPSFAMTCSLHFANRFGPGNIPIKIMY